MIVDGLSSHTSWQVSLSLPVPICCIIYKVEGLSVECRERYVVSAVGVTSHSCNLLYTVVVMRTLDLNNKLELKIENDQLLSYLLGRN